MIVDRRRPRAARSLALPLSGSEVRLQLRQNFDDPQHEFLTRRAVGRDKVLCAKELVSLRVAKAPSNLIGAPRAARTPVMEQFFFASALCDFFDSQRGLAPPAGSAARARPGRARGPWERQYYGIPTRWRRRGPLARHDAAAGRRLQPPQAKRMRGQNQQHIISGQESSSTRPATTRQRRRCGRRTRARRGAASANPARRHFTVSRTETRTFSILLYVAATVELKTNPTDRLTAPKSMTPGPSSGTSRGARRRPREASSPTSCRSWTASAPKSARICAVHRSN